MYPTFQALRAQFVQQLSDLYSARESKSLFAEAVAFVANLSKAELAMQLSVEVSDNTAKKLTTILEKLQLGVPIQYITGRAWFMDHWFSVNAAVLIPRPETEELVRWILEDYNEPLLRFLDVGTGSGCIPISIADARPRWQVFACDISDSALEVAKKNAVDLVDINKVSFYNEDILNPLKFYDTKLDIIVSNPPYVLEKDKLSMTKHVLDHEPHLALFVDDEDPLLFYRHILVYTKNNLRPGGSVYFEVHEDLAEDVALELLKFGFYQTEIKQDMQGKDRMVKGVFRERESE